MLPFCDLPRRGVYTVYVLLTLYVQNDLKRVCTKKNMCVLRHVSSILLFHFIVFFVAIFHLFKNRSFFSFSLIRRMNGYVTVLEWGKNDGNSYKTIRCTFEIERIKEYEKKPILLFEST